MSGEPQRLLDSPELGEALRTDLARAAAHDVGYDVEAGLARFEANLSGGGPSPGPGDGGATAAGAGGAAGGKLTLVVGLAVVVTGSLIAWSQLGGSGDGPPSTTAAMASAEAPPATSPTEPVVPTPLESPEAAAAGDGAELPRPPQEPSTESGQTPAEEAAATTDPVQAADPSPTPRPRTGTKPRPSAARQPAAKPDNDALRREMQATDRARQALSSDPDRALTLVRKANREFEGGLFGEDREGIEILALFGLGRSQKARARAKKFLRAHPRSSYADKIRAALDDSAP